MRTLMVREKVGVLRMEWAFRGKVWVEMVFGWGEQRRRRMMQRERRRRKARKCFFGGPTIFGRVRVLVLDPEIS